MNQKVSLPFALSLLAICLVVGLVVGRLMPVRAKATPTSSPESPSRPAAAVATAIDPGAFRSSVLASEAAWLAAISETTQSEDFPKLIEQLQNEFPSYHSEFNVILEAILQQWVKVDATSAIAWARSEDGGAGARRTVYEHLALTDANRAIAAANELEPIELNGVARGLLQSNEPMKAVRFMIEYDLFERHGSVHDGNELIAMALDGVVAESPGFILGSIAKAPAKFGFWSKQLVAEALARGESFEFFSRVQTHPNLDTQTKSELLFCGLTVLAEADVDRAIALRGEWLAGFSDETLIPSNGNLDAAIASKLASQKGPSQAAAWVGGNMAGFAGLGRNQRDLNTKIWSQYGVDGLFEFYSVLNDSSVGEPETIDGLIRVAAGPGSSEFPPTLDPRTELDSLSETPGSNSEAKVLRTNLARSAYTAWAEQNPLEAWADYSSRMVFSEDDEILRALVGATPDLSVLWENRDSTLPSARALDSYFDEAVDRLPSSEVIAMAESLEPREIDSVTIETVVASGRPTDAPRLATLAAKHLDDSTESTDTLSTVVRKWTKNDPIAASEWVGAQTAGPVRDTGAFSLAKSVAAEDPEAAFAWARTIEGDDMRSRALRATYRKWGTVAPRDAAEALAAESQLTADEREALLEAMSAP